MTINAVSLGWLSKIVKFLASNSPLITFYPFRTFVESTTCVLSIRNEVPEGRPSFVTARSEGAFDLIFHH
jgi:hypothetical protein